jgi:hypothetical protein
MTLALSPWTGNGHEVGQQFAGGGLDLFVGGLPKDVGEDRMRHLCLNALCRHSIGSHYSGGVRSAKGRRLVGSDDHTDDSNEKHRMFGISSVRVWQRRQWTRS